MPPAHDAARTSRRFVARLLFCGRRLAADLAPRYPNSSSAPVCRPPASVFEFFHCWRRCGLPLRLSGSHCRIPRSARKSRRHYASTAMNCALAS